MMLIHQQRTVLRAEMLTDLLRLHKKGYPAFRKRGKFIPAADAPEYRVSFSTDPLVNLPFRCDTSLHVLIIFLIR